MGLPKNPRAIAEVHEWRRKLFARAYGILKGGGLTAALAAPRRREKNKEAHRIETINEITQYDRGLKTKLMAAMTKTKLDAKSELKRFLPASQHGLLKNFKAILTAEIEKNLP